MSNNDRGWIYKRIEGRLISKEWITRLETQFLNTSFSNEAIVKRKSVGGTFKQAIRCPCSNCKCKKYKCRDDVHLDLMKFGFQPDYTTWWAHGEAFSYAQEIGECSNSTRDDDNDFDGCTRMVLDNMHPVDFNNWEEQVPNSSAKGFYDMLQAADTPLYPGCQTFSTLEWAARLLNWKSECNVPVSTYDRLVRDLNEAFPMGSNVDKNFYETKRRLSKLSLPVEKIDACKNHCMLYYKEKKGLVNCEVCGSSRYKINGRSKIPNLVLRYFPIIPRLQRMYMSKKTAKDMTWHYDHPREDGKMVHPSDGEAWKHFDSTHPSFANEIRNVRLGLCTDGFTPNNQSSNPYSLWPVFLTIYNLPPWMCLKDDYVNLSLVIPGRKSPGQNLDVFLQPLIDELKVLYEDGVETYDKYRRNNFRMRAILLWTVSDFPAYAMLSGWSTHGKLACPSCMGDINSFQLYNGGKPCWFDCHRRFLPENNQFRRDVNGFKIGTIMSCGPPPQLTGDEIWEQSKFEWGKEQETIVKHNWESILKRRFRDLMRDARKDATDLAIKSGVNVRDDLSVLKPFHPDWIDQRNWAAMIDDYWNTESWKEKSAKNKRNRATLVEGKMAGHSGGSRSMVHTQVYMEKQKGGPVPFVDVYASYFTKTIKTRTGPSDSGELTTLIEFTTPKAANVLSKYNELMEEDFGPNSDEHPTDIVTTLWEKACGGMKKGNLFGATKDILVVAGGTFKSSMAGPSNGEVETLRAELKRQKIEAAETKKQAEIAEKEAEELKAKVTELEDREKAREEKMKSLEEQMKAFTKFMQNMPQSS